MRKSRWRFVCTGLALAALAVMGGAIGCGGAGSGGAVMAKADVVDVTYYYLPG